MAIKLFLCIVFVLVFSVGSAFSARVVGFPPGPNPTEVNPVLRGSFGLEVFRHIDPSGPSRRHSEHGGFGAVHASEGQNGKHAAYISGFRVYKPEVPSAAIPIGEDPVTNGFGFTGSKREVPAPGKDPIHNDTPTSGGV